MGRCREPARDIPLVTKVMRKEAGHTQRRVHDKGLSSPNVRRAGPETPCLRGNGTPATPGSRSAARTDVSLTQRAELLENRQDSRCGPSVSIPYELQLLVVLRKMGDWLGRVCLSFPWAPPPRALSTLLQLPPVPRAPSEGSCLFSIPSCFLRASFFLERS